MRTMEKKRSRRPPTVAVSSRQSFLQQDTRARVCMLAVFDLQSCESTLALLKRSEYDLLLLTFLTQRRALSTSSRT